MLKKQKSHISVSSLDGNDNSVNCLYQNSNNSNSNKNNKVKITHANNKNVEQYLNKLILISLKHKKFLERNDYFYSQLHKKNKLKKVKLKLTPFQQYEQYKHFSKKLQLNNILNSFPKNNIEYKKENRQINNLFTAKNENRYLKKNRTQTNERFCVTSSHHMYKSRSKVKQNKKIFINSLDINFLPEPKIKKNKYSSVSYDTNLNTNKSDKMKIINKYKLGLRQLSNKGDNNLYNASKGKRSIGVLTSAAFHPLKIINIKSRNNRILGLPKISVDNRKYPVPLINMDSINFLMK